MNDAIKMMAKARRKRTYDKIPDIVRAMETYRGNEKLQYKATMTLLNFAWVDDANRKRIAEEGGIAAILRAMESHKTSERIQEHGCWALWDLAGNAENQKWIAKEGGIVAILRAMESHKTSEGVQHFGCGALYSLANNNAENKKRIAKEGGIEAILRAMESHKDVHVQKFGKHALDSLQFDPATYVSPSATTTIPHLPSPSSSSSSSATKTSAPVKGEMMVVRPSPSGGASKPVPLRLATSRFLQLYKAINAKWRSSDYWKTSDRRVKRRIIEMISSLLRSYGKSKSVDELKSEDFIDALLEIIDDNLSTKHGHTTAEAMSVLLWTSAKTLRVGTDDREFCSILNEIVRTDGGNPAFEEAVKLICMIQHFLNASRRGSKFQVLPLGPGAPQGKGWSTKRDTVFRGGGLPTRHLAFFKALAGTDRYYRAAQLVATSFSERKAYEFIRRASAPKVLWIIKIDPTLGCFHVNYIDNSITAVKNECEYLFSAFSAFKVVKVEVSSTPEKWTTPHKITLYAAPDNSLESEDVPTAPWC